MLAFEVYVNKVKVCTAGLDELEFVAAHLVSVVNMDGNPEERKIWFGVSGKNREKLYSWVHCPMEKGNRVEIRIVDAKKTDEPKEVTCS